MRIDGSMVHDTMIPNGIRLQLTSEKGRNYKHDDLKT